MASDKHRSFEEVLNHVVEAIHLVVNVEVTIVDAKYRRLAATGLYACQVGGRINEKSAFAKAMQIQKSFFIDSPTEDPICLECEGKNDCCETAEVCCPIILEGVAVGAIGLIAFDDLQKESLLKQRSYLIPFLESMANLIASKIKEMRQGEELELLTNAVEHPLFTMSADGQLIRTNDAADQLWHKLPKFKIKDSLSDQETSMPRFITDLIDSKDLEKLIAGNMRFQVQGISTGQSFELQARAIEADQLYAVILKPLKEMIGYANRYLSSSAVTTFDDILGEHSKLKEAKDFALKAANSAATVLILGESGTGKELFARAIHQASDRKQQVFLAMNCAAIPESLMESELFGYEEGTFTGSAKGGRIGRFEQAHKGTLFLDEIGDMPLHLQTKLLRVLQEGKITRLGGRTEIPVDVRIVAATHRHIEQMVEEGSFREDLFYRINVLPLELPSLRERKEDIESITAYFVSRSSKRLGKQVKALSEEVLHRLRAYEWPGNVRELENAAEYMVHMSTGPQIEEVDLPKRLRTIEKEIPRGITPTLNSQGVSGEILCLETLERQAIERAIDRYGKDKTGILSACSALGISRATLYRKLQFYKL